MILTEADLRDRLRRPTQGAQVAVPPGARLSPAAADFVAQWRLVLTDEPGPHPTGAHGDGTGERPWDRDATFPIDTTSGPPRCTQCGTQVATKPSWLTQLNRSHYAPKTHPRIVLRGQLDSLGAQLLATAAQALAAGQDAAVQGEARQGEAAAHLASLAAYCRELLSAEYNERPAAELTLDGWDADAIRHATHDPAGVLGVEHITLTERSAPLQHAVNACRARAREVEVTATGVFPSPHHHYGPSVCLGLNRLSSACYLVQLLLARGGVG